MKHTNLFLFIFLLYIFSLPLLADEIEYKGIIESRPEGTAGIWVVGGKTYNATEKTKIDEEKGALNVGACAEVETDKKGNVTEIETESMKKCQK